MTAIMRARRERLRELEREGDGLLPAERVVEDARNPESPLHGVEGFLWDDDAAAAQEHRLEIARRLIRSVRYEETITEYVLATPRYVHVTLSAEDKGYMDMDRVMTRKDLSKEVLNDEIKRATAALTRARNVADTLGCRDSLEMVIGRLLEIQRKAA